MSMLYAHPVPEALRNPHLQAAIQAQGSDRSHLPLPPSAHVYANGSRGKRLHGILSDSAAVHLYLSACWTEVKRRANEGDMRDFVAWGSGMLGMSGG